MGRNIRRLWLRGPTTQFFEYGHTGMINYGRQDINQADVDSVIEILNSDFLTQGPQVPIFEKKVASKVGARFGVAVNSGTSALHIACLALGVGEGDVVWTTATTFVASANCALYCGADVDFIDINPDTYNMDIDALASKLAVARESGKLPKVVIPVHMCGQSCDMEVIHDLGQKYGFRIIEDAAHALGSTYHDNYVGSCRYSDITIFSFHPVKIITTSEGGMAVTNSQELAKLMQQFRSHGITSDLELMSERPNDQVWNYQQLRLGFNYRMTDIQAALGLSQMGRLEAFVAGRRAIARRYDEAFSELPIKLPFQDGNGQSSYHLYIIRVDIQESGHGQKAVYENLHRAGIIVNLHYIPVYRHPFFEQMGFKEGYCPEAEKYFSEALSIPIYPSMTDVQVEEVVEKVSALF